MSAIIACTAGRDALDAIPTTNATPAMASGWTMNPRTATETAVDSWAISMVGRRPSRSVITPAPSEETTPPSPWSAATSPAYEAE